MVESQAFVCWFTWFWFDVVGVGCADFSFVAAALWLWWWPSFLAFPAGFGGFGWDCGGVVCELDSVFVFCFYACFLFLSIFLVGIAYCFLWWVFRAYCFYSFVRRV